jgi:predicted esterase
MRKVLLITVLSLMMFGSASYAQNVFNPNDPIVNYDPNNPPATPPANTIAKWVRTPHPKVTWNTSKFKAYYYNGIAFRLRFPSNYDPNNTAKKYPVIFFMHGGGEIGPVTDNEFHLLLGAQMFEKMMDNGQFDAFMIFPQARNVAWENWQFAAMNNIVDTLQKYHNADIDRVIAMGLSIGGHGSLWYSSLYPTRSATAIPSSPAFITLFNSQVDNFVHIPTWVASGSQDNNPDPPSVSSFVNAFKSKGGDIKSSVYNVGHTSWDFQWKELDLVKYWKNAHKANPIVFFQKNQIHPDSPINSRMGISAGFYAYEWQRDGITIATGTNGANSILDATTVISNTGNEITVRKYGVYSARFKRTSSSPWSVWSPVPVVITANPIARPLDQNINLPYAEILNGSGSTAVAGSRIVKYLWTKISGPASYNLITPDSPNTWINSVTKGVYVFRLTVTDDKGRTGSADMTLTVNDGTQNTVPIANAGPNRQITLPANSVTLDGSASSAGPGLTLTSYSWTKVSGPASSTIATPNAASTAVNNLTEGIYVFRLTVTDNVGNSSSADVNVTVGAAPATTPVARAGNSQSITLPANSVTLDGSASTAPSGMTLTGYQWSKISGPSQFTIASPNAVSANVSNLVEGVYTFRLTVTASNNATHSADVSVTVNGAGSGLPVANAGKDETIPVGQATVLHGENSTPPPGGTIVAYLWNKISGPAKFEILTPTEKTTWIRNMDPGVFVFRLTVTDNQNRTSTDEVVITVQGSQAEPTTARAGNNQSITLPSSATLDGSGSTPAAGASITGYNWSKVSGPASYNIVSPTSVSTTVSNLQEGTYVFRLRVTDNLGATSTSDVTVTVYASGSAVPVANAGTDETIPVGQATVLNSTGSSSPNGGITGYLWSRISGPTQVEMLTPTASSTWIRNMVAGTYVFRLTVTDNVGKTATDDVNIIVKSSLSEPTTARAGSNQAITLPTNSVTLDGSGSTAASGALITGYNWSKISGPSSFAIVTPNSISTSVNSLVAGTYVFRLRVTDDKGAVSTSDVTVTVYQAGTAVPVADAGKDETIPVGQATVLRGELSSSPNGSIVKYQWTKFSGPAQFEMLTPTEKNTWIRNMVAGTYVFRLTVTDNVGKTAYDDVVITVYSTASQSLSTRNQQMTPNGTNLITENFVLYPNPVVDQINLRWSSMYKGSAMMNIYDMGGRRVKSVTIKKEQSDLNDRMDVSDLQKGMYFLEIRLPDGKVGIQKTFQK